MSKLQTFMCAHFLLIPMNANVITHGSTKDLLSLCVELFVMMSLVLTRVSLAFTKMTVDINLCKTAGILSKRVMHTESIITCISHLCDICTEGFVVPIATHCKTMQSTTKYKHRCKNVMFMQVKWWSPPNFEWLCLWKLHFMIKLRV